MIVTEIISNSSKEFFEGIPENRHRMMMDYFEMSEKISRGYNGFIRLNCLELLKQNFLASEFQPFDPHILLERFSDYCQERRRECNRIMQVGFLEDMREFVSKFVYGQ